MIDPGSYPTLQEGDFYFQDRYTRERIDDILQARRPDFLHISMHSSLKLGLCFEDQQAIGTSEVFPAEAEIVYANAFYTDLFTGKDIASCHGSGQSAIRKNQPPFAAVNAVAVDALIQLF